MKGNDSEEELKNIAREAEYLIEQLSTRTVAPQLDSDKSPKERGSAILASESQSNTKPSPEKIDQRTNAKPSNPGTVVGLLSALFFLAVWIMHLVNQSGTSVSDPPRAPSDDIAGLTKLEHDSKDAVLICELRPIINRANSLLLNNQAYVARKNTIVSDATQSIATLDASSAKGYKYWEDPSCTWGEQWFDQHNENSFRVFIALSKKCVNPRLHYKYALDREGNNIISQGSPSLSGHRTGEIAIPYLSAKPFEYYVFIKNVSCS